METYLNFFTDQLHGPTLSRVCAAEGLGCLRCPESVWALQRAVAEET